MSKDTLGGLPYGSFSGPYNAVGGDVGAYNTVCVMVAAEYCFVQGMVPGTVVVTCEPCLAFLRTSSSFYEPRSKGRGVRVRSSALGKAFRSERASGGQSECSDQSGGPKGSSSGRRSFQTMAW